MDRIAGWIGLMAGALVVGGCQALAPETSSRASGAFELAPQFAVFWDAYGGVETFGPPIEPASFDGALLRQAVVNAELVFDPAAPEESRVYLSPLGPRLGLAEPAVPPAPDGRGWYFESTGHTLYTGFLQAYEALGGPAVVGPPIAEVRFRDGLIVQYFTNLGLVRQESAAPSQVRLLGYGLASRPLELAQALARPADLPPPDLRQRPFALFLDRYLGEHLLGPPLTDAYLAPDGALEQVFERGVLFSPLTDPSSVRLRPLGRELGAAEPAVPDAGDPFGLYAPETGHNIGWAFAAFYRDHGGAAVLGLPLGEAGLEDGSLRQVYENVILEYRFDLPPALAVQLRPLGSAYLERFGASAARPTAAPPPSTPAAPAQDLLQVVTWVERSVLPLGNAQTIYLEVRRPDGTPWAGVVPLISVHAPRWERALPVPATDEQGRAQVTFVPEDVFPGEIVSYEIAVVVESGVGYATGQFAIRFPD
jgi:hypothetical protein